MLRLITWICLLTASSLFSATKKDPTKEIIAQVTRGEEYPFPIETSSGLPAGTIVLRRGDLLDAKRFSSPDAIVNAANTGMLGGSAIDGEIHKATGGDTLKKFNQQIKNIKGCPVGGAWLSPSFDISPVSFSAQGLLQPAAGTHFIISVVGPDTNIKEQNITRKSLLRSAYSGALQMAASWNLFSLKGPHNACMSWMKEPPSLIEEAQKYKTAIWCRNIELVQDYFISPFFKTTPPPPSLSFKASFPSITSIGFPTVSTGVYRYPLQEATEQALYALITTMQWYAQELQDRGYLDRATWPLFTVYCYIYLPPGGNYTTSDPTISLYVHALHSLQNSEGKIQDARPLVSIQESFAQLDEELNLLHLMTHESL